MKKSAWMILNTIALITFLVGLATLVLYLAMTWDSLTVPFAGEVDLQASGQSGDFIGGTVGTLWALTAVVLLYMTLYLQQKELAETQELLSQQAFESTFFKLLENQRAIVKEIEIDMTLHHNWDGLIQKSSKTAKGRDFFLRADLELYQLFHYYTIAESDEKQRARGFSAIQHYDISFGEVKDRAEYVYDCFQNAYPREFSHYFRHLYYLLVFVEEEIKKSEKLNSDSDISMNSISPRHTSYLNSIQAQMSSSELIMLFYNGLKYAEMRKIVDKFSLLSSLPVEELWDPTHTAYYPKTKFSTRKDKLIRPQNADPNPKSGLLF